MKVSIIEEDMIESSDRQEKIEQLTHNQQNQIVEASRQIFCSPLTMEERRASSFTPLSPFKLAQIWPLFSEKKGCQYPGNREIGGGRQSQRKLTLSPQCEAGLCPPSHQDGSSRRGCTGS